MFMPKRNHIGASIIGLFFWANCTNILAQDVLDRQMIQPLEVAQGKIATLTFAEDEEWKLLPKLEIIFQIDNQGYAPVVLYEVGLQSTDKHEIGKWGNEPIGLVRLGEKVQKKGGAIGLKLGVVAPGYAYAARNVLVLGNEYRIWSPEYGGSALFKLPNKNEKNKDLRLVWCVNKKMIESQVADKRPKLIAKINGKFPAIGHPWIMLYVNPTSKHQQFADFVDGMASMEVNELGGNLVVGQMIEGSPVWLYVSSVQDCNLTFPDDAEHVFSPKDNVKCAFELQGSSQSVETVKAMGIFARKGDDLPILWLDLLHSDNPKESALGKDYVVEFNMSPGEYWVCFYGRDLNAEKMTLSEGNVKIEKRDDVFKASWKLE